MKDLIVKTSSRTQFVDITDQVAGAVSEYGQKDGVAVVFVPHTTAGITINENADPDVVADITAVLDRTVPWSDGYRHSEGNSAAHVKASLMGSSVNVIVQNGALRLGTWQSIYFCEFDGPRTRKVYISIHD